MRNRFLVATLILIGIALLAAGCNLPMLSGGSDSAATVVVQTIAVLQTGLAGSQTAAASVPPPAATALPPAPPTLAPQPVPTAAKPVVNATALCWTGPGNAYPVVSSVKPGTEVEVLGVGSIVGWLVIKNPRYGDACWVEIKYMTLDPYFNTAGMRVFNPPPTPGPTETPVPTPT